MAKPKTKPPFTLCKNCYCMTKTIAGKCGKCKKIKLNPHKPSSQEVEKWCEHNKNIRGVYTHCEVCKPSSSAYKTLWPEPKQQLKGLARELAWSELLDIKDKKLLCVFFKEYIDTIKRL